MSKPTASKSTASKPTVLKKVSIVILSWNGRHHLETCLPALAGQKVPGVEVDTWVLDNGSVDGTQAWVEEHYPDVKLVRSDVNLGFCAGNNRLVDVCDGDVVILLNNDTRPRADWLAAMVDALASAPDDVAAISGTIVDWEGDRLDFGRGLITFDGHAFQWHYGRPLATAEIPRQGEEIPFACGGNMIIWKHAFQEAGGFDPDYFAYLEDVDLGWRLWSSGHRITFAPDAVVHHRSMATSQLLGNANRGFLFERNAFSTVYKNLDPALFGALMPVVWTTLVHRAQTLMVQNNPGGELLTLDPYAGLIANTASPVSHPSAKARKASGEGDPQGSDGGNEVGLLDGPLAKPVAMPRTSLAEKWRGYGTKELARRGLRKGLRSVLPAYVFDEVPGAKIQDPRTLAHQQAITWLLGHLDSLAARRVEVQARRIRPDQDYFERFPLAIVPTYPGDGRLFQSRAFADLLPSELTFERFELDEVMGEE